VIVRYAGSQIATGGTVTTIGGDTIHTFTGNGTFGIQAGSFRSTLSGVIGGSGDFTFNGPGTLSLAAANSYSGDTIIAAGTLQVGDGGSTGTLGGTGSVANDGMLAFNRSDAILFYREITGAGGLVQAGSGTLTVSATNSHTGGTTISAGTLALGSAGALGTAGPISLTGGTLQFSAVNTTDYSSRFSTAAGQGYRLDTNGEDVTLAGDLTSSGGSLEKVGSGTLTLTGANTYSGGTTISAGTLVGTTVSLQGNIANAAALVFDQAADGGFAGVISGTGSLTKNNAGNLVLSGSNSYTGPTSITAGRLSVNGSLAGTAVNVFNGGTLGPSSAARGASVAPWPCRPAAGFCPATASACSRRGRRRSITGRSSRTRSIRASSTPSAPPPTCSWSMAASTSPRARCSSSATWPASPPRRSSKTRPCWR